MAARRLMIYSSDFLETPNGRIERGGGQVGAMEGLCGVGWRGVGLCWWGLGREGASVIGYPALNCRSR